MAFLDNSGDIILDAVLTDTGRFRLAKGDGSFKIAKFAFGDDEINYENYNKLDSRGSAYFDLDILQTPVLEAFTNNTSTMNSKLITIPRTNLLYLPILRINDKTQNSQLSAESTTTNSFVVMVDQDTVDALTAIAANTPLENQKGLLDGTSTQSSNANHIRIDQGLHTSEIPISFTLDPDLKETNYIVQMDHRLGQLSDPDGGLLNPRFIDDDNIAHYFLSQGVVAASMIQDNFATDSTDTDAESKQVINGPRGTVLMFKIQSSIELASSTFLFGELGGTLSSYLGVSNLQSIDTIIKVQGATTGYAVDVPVKFIKKS